MNSIGHLFRFTSFGESHGQAVGGVVDGCPAGMLLDEDAIRQDLDRRAGRNLSGGVSARARKEEDKVVFLSGLADGYTMGTPIAFFIQNTETRPEDYDSLKEVFRPGHADYTYAVKYGIRDYRGGGRSSARETAARVVAGSIAKQWLTGKEIRIHAETTAIGGLTDPQAIEDLLRKIAQAGDSVGGIVTCTVQGLPAGIGEPLFDKLQARLAYSVMSINACKGFDYGSGFALADRFGSELNDPMPYHTNHAGGILGGISNGQDIVFRAVFKPTPSIAKPQRTLDIRGQEREISVHGRHDTCIALRAPVIVEAMAALTLADLMLEADSRPHNRIPIAPSYPL